MSGNSPYATGGVIRTHKSPIGLPEGGCEYVILRRRTRMTSMTEDRSRLWDNEPLAVAVNAWLRANRINPNALPADPRPVINGDRIEYLSVCEDGEDVRTVDDVDHLPLSTMDPNRSGGVLLFPKSTPLLTEPSTDVAEWLRTGDVGEPA